MKMEFEQVKGISCCWNATLNGKLVGKIVVDNSTTPSKVWASDHTIPEPEYVRGSPFETVNQAKAALEYYFSE